jgi:RNA polymerase sigma-70 factor (ECF subfamily)
LLTLERAETAAPDDTVLARRAAHDREAFAALYARYLDPVYRYCYRRLGTRELAEDATSQVFHNVLAALDRFHGGSFRAWLFTIAHNVVTDTYRRRRPVSPLDMAREVADTGQTPEELAVSADERRAVRDLVRQLPSDQQRVVELRLAGLTGAEIAEVLERSTSAVKMLQHRAMTRLRQLAAAPHIAEEHNHAG